MTTESPPKTHCPTCGAKILRPHLSLCSYCSTPLGLVGEAKPAENATVQRLARMREHPEYAAALAWDPPADEQERARLLNRRGRLLGVLALVFLVWGFFTYPPGTPDPSFAAAPQFLRLPNFVAAVCALGWALLVLKARKLEAQASGFPLRKRAALVASRRSETSAQRGHGGTVYFFTLELEDGSAGEFAWPGQGTAYEPLVPGNTGVAYTRRDRLAAFRVIRV